MFDDEVKDYFGFEIGDTLKARYNYLFFNRYFGKNYKPNAENSVAEIYKNVYVWVVEEHKNKGGYTNYFENDKFIEKINTEEEYTYPKNYYSRTFLIFSYENKGNEERTYVYRGAYKPSEENKNNKEQNKYEICKYSLKLIPFYYPSFEEFKENGEIIREYVPYIQYDYYRTDNEERMNDLTIGMEELNMSNYIIDNMRVILLSSLNEKMKDEVDYLYLLDDLEERLYNESFENSNYIDDEHNVLVKDTSILEISKKITMHFIDVMNKNI